jgi:hypothetical protein
MKSHLVKTLEIPESDVATCVLFKKILPSRNKK